MNLVEPGTMAVASAFPDPPFELDRDGSPTGFDVELIQAVCRELGVVWKLVRYDGHDFNGIFDGLATGSYDAVISGTTITPDREKVARFSRPYLESGQSLVVNIRRNPTFRSVHDLRGQVVGIQVGNTSDLVARKLKAEGAIADIRYYPYSGILDALDDLTAGRIGAFMKLLPVTTWLVKDRPELEVVEEIPTHGGSGSRPRRATPRSATRSTWPSTRWSTTGRSPACGGRGSATGRRREHPTRAPLHRPRRRVGLHRGPGTDRSARHRDGSQRVRERHEHRLHRERARVEPLVAQRAAPPVRRDPERHPRIRDPHPRQLHDRPR